MIIDSAEWATSLSACTAVLDTLSLTCQISGSYINISSIITPSSTSGKTITLTVNGNNIAVVKPSTFRSSVYYKSTVIGRATVGLSFLQALPGTCQTSRSVSRVGLSTQYTLVC